jgi:tRNA (guanine37-N1)-methyltransferase
MSDEAAAPGPDRPDRFAFVLVTLFPELFDSFLAASLIGKALAAGVLGESRVNPRDFTTDVHRTVDDAPYGGGAGMVMKPAPLAAAIARARELAPPGTPCVLLGPTGEPFRQATARALAAQPGLILVCGRYEGIDERVKQRHVDLELSLGDYVLSGGEVAAMAVMEATSRLLPGVLGNAESVDEESFAAGLLEYPQYTRPVAFEGLEVPELLRSGDHAKVRDWRRAQALWRTRMRRPDLYAALPPSPADERLMERYPPEGGAAPRR